jgi:hypothetical protein
VKRFLLAAALGLALAAASSKAADTAMMGNASAGQARRAAACGLGSYLAGLQYWWPRINTIRPYCAKMDADGKWIGAPVLANEVMAAGYHASDDAQYLAACPRDSWVSGYSGYTAAEGLQSVTQVTLACRNLVTGWMTNIQMPLRDGFAQAEWPMSYCDQSSVAVAAVGATHDDDLVLRFGLACSTTQPALRAQARLGTSSKVGAAIKPAPAPPAFRPTVPAERPAVAALSPQRTQLFAPPVNRDGTRLVACQTVGGVPCGQSPADAFCKAAGFAHALSFQNGMERVRAETLLGQKCVALECNVFNRIECGR